MELNRTFGQHIRALHKAKKLTQHKLAKRVASRLREEDRRGFDGFRRKFSRLVDRG